MPPVLRAELLSRFTCLGEHCPDTCCRGWSMQVDDKTKALYAAEAPELLNALEQSGNGQAMRQFPSGACVKLEEGMCGIQKTFGETFLGDACHFYPRVTRALGDTVVMTAALSCPEIARLALYDDAEALTLEAQTLERLPVSLKNYLPAGLSAADALAVHNAFIGATRDPAATPEQVFLRIATVARFIERNEVKDWPRAVPFYFQSADSYVPAAQHNAADPFNLLHALAGLIVASHKIISPLLTQTISEMEQALAATLDWQQVTIAADEKSVAAYRAVRSAWQNTYAEKYKTVLKKYIAMQMSLALFPFAGVGNSLSERISIIGVRFATLRLALMCGCVIHNDELPQEAVVRIVESLSRFLDHLGDPAFSLQIYAETGWLSEARMRGVLET